MIKHISENAKKDIAFFLFLTMWFQCLVPLYVFAGGGRSLSNTSAHYTSGTPDIKQILVQPVWPARNKIRNVQFPKKMQKTSRKASPLVLNGNYHPPAWEEDIDGPSQPEMSQFKSIGSDNMVDLFTGDFSYNIPLLDVGGYPVNISYSSQVGMEQESSWVGLGWNINPGAITRNMRGLPDDFNGTDQIIKTNRSKPLTVVGGSIGAAFEFTGFPLNIGVNLGAFYNSKSGWGTEFGINPSVNLSGQSKGDLNGGCNLGIGLNFNSQEGTSISPSFGYSMSHTDAGTLGSNSISTNYNSRRGLTSLTLSNTIGSEFSSELGSGTISFVRPSVLPTISTPYTSQNFSFTLGIGGEVTVAHIKGNLNGYYTRSRIDYYDETQRKAAFGYLYSSNSNNNSSALLDFNRDRETPYREKPIVQNIAIPSYTYDAFAMTGEGISGMFRPYRGDVGHTYDHDMTTRSQSFTGGVDIGIGYGVKWGGNFSYANTKTTNSSWDFMNSAVRKLNYTAQQSRHEPVYFRNTAEISVNNEDFNNAIGGDKLVKLHLENVGTKVSPVFGIKSDLDVYSNQYGIAGKVPISSNISTGNEREKRSQVITYMTADEAVLAGMRFITSYDTNYFHTNCDPDVYRTEYIERKDAAIRKGHHISAVSVLNKDGKRYEYGIAAYNTENKEVTYSLRRYKTLNVARNLAYSQAFNNDMDPKTGETLGYKTEDEIDISTDRYFNRQIMPPYSHSFLLTGIYSADYMDVTGDGPTEDDLGDGVQFNYSRLFGIGNSSYKWRTPMHPVNHSICEEEECDISRIDSANGNYEEGLKTDYRDDKASYAYGAKEIWYLNSIESKTMIATFWVEGRKDAVSQENELGGNVASKKLCRLKEIRLFSKSDFGKYGPQGAKPIKTVHFDYNYELCPGFPLNIEGEDSGKLTLKKIWFTYNGNDKGKENPYEFHYRNNQSYQYQAADNWGNYKDPSDNPGELSNKDYPYPVNVAYIAGKDANIAPWALDQIQLPAGSRITVTYEADDYGFVQNKRALQFCQVIKAGKTQNYNEAGNRLYENEDDANDHKYIFVKVPEPVTTKKEVYEKYLKGLDYLYFRIAVTMPYDPAFDIYNKKQEFIKTYTRLDGNNYGVVESDHEIIWFKIKGTEKKGVGDGEYSPLVKSAIQFLRNELPSKAFPGSQFPADQTLDVATFTSALIGSFGEVKNMIKGFHTNQKISGACKTFDNERSFVRIACPGYSKIGGGYRVKRIEITDNWYSMTGQPEAVYGQEYNYTIGRSIAGKKQMISSGVASYEPVIGGEENPFRNPIENYNEQSAPLGPVNSLYTEGPLMESLYPAASVGYSRVVVKSIHGRNVKSLTGWDETRYFTAYDYPVIEQKTPITDGFKKFSTPPAIINPFKWYSRKDVGFSQGFKIELNDMHGKMRSQASYAAVDSVHPINSTTYFYKSIAIDNQSKKLDNSVLVVDRMGNVENAQIGRDIELMTDFRQQKSFMFSGGINANVHLFTIGIYPIVIPAFLKFPQFDENIYRAAAVNKIINRHAILDSVVVMDKGSKVSTENLLYDAETGDVIVTRTRNEFDDPIYNIKLPAYWAYDRMGPAYNNIGINITDNLLYGQLENTDNEQYFVPGDEVLAVYNNLGVPWNQWKAEMLWVAKAKLYEGEWDTTYQNPVTDYPGPGPNYAGLAFFKRDGMPFSHDNVNLKIIRSGRRNIFTADAGNITTNINPIDGEHLNIDASEGILNATATEYKEDWKVQKKYWITDSCQTSCNCPEGYERDVKTGLCIAISASIIAPDDNPRRVVAANYHEYQDSCVRIFDPGYDEYGQGSSTQYHVDAHPFWTNVNGWDNQGAFNRSAIWVADSAGTKIMEVVQHAGIVFPINIPQTKTYYLGFSADDEFSFSVDCQEVIKAQAANGYDGNNWKHFWDVYPIELTKGYHTLQLTGINTLEVNAVFGAEIYDNTREELIADSTGENIHIIFSTKDYIGKYLQVSMIEGGGAEALVPPAPCDGGCVHLDDNNQSYCASYSTESPTCDTDTFDVFNFLDHIKYPDTISIDIVNPYVRGILGNYRPYRNYVFYNNRVEQNASEATTDIRHYGTIDNFQPFWVFGEGWLTPTYQEDWVWNNENTLYNRKGLSIETKDPLGRYTAGQYGYNNTLPVALTQNSKFRESYFEGFEDYEFDQSSCQNEEDACKKEITRNLTWLATGNLKPIKTFSSEEHHSGHYSVHATEDGGEQGTILTLIGIVDTTDLFAKPIWLRYGEGIIATNYTSQLPYNVYVSSGDSILISAWVKIAGECVPGNDSAKIFVEVDYESDNQTYEFSPAGPIIEGWQKIEAIVGIDHGANLMVVILPAYNPNTYFDDFRIHPYHANMKSFVYDPISLRLSAELDENNYASFYEYDNDGTLVRVKKETEKGIKTIKETRSALLKTEQ